MVTAYPVAGKQKCLEICQAFVRGCGGRIARTLRDGPAFFYGVDDSNRAIWEQVLAEKRDFWYCDNSYFDSARQQHFRVTKNALQHTGVGTSDGKRFVALGIDIKPWRVSGDHIVVCPQSDHFMRVLVGYPGNWCKEVMEHLEKNSKRPIRLRAWSANKGALAATLRDDLQGAHALITWSSAAAVTAALEGVPVIVQSNDCGARPMSGDPWELEALPMRDRLNWAGVLADNEWSLDEMRDGTAWKALNAIR